MARSLAEVTSPPMRLVHAPFAGGCSVAVVVVGVTLMDGGVERAAAMLSEATFPLAVMGGGDELSPSKSGTLAMVGTLDRSALGVGDEVTRSPSGGDKLISASLLPFCSFRITLTVFV